MWVALTAIILPLAVWRSTVPSELHDIAVDGGGLPKCTIATAVAMSRELVQERWPAPVDEPPSAYVFPPDGNAQVTDLGGCQFKVRSSFSAERSGGRAGIEYEVILGQRGDTSMWESEHIKAIGSFGLSR